MAAAGGPPPPTSGQLAAPAGAAPPSGSAPAPASAAAPPPPPLQKSDLSPVLQQLSLESIRTRTNDLYKAISSIIQSFQTAPHHKWSEVLGQFSMVNVELLNLVEDIKPILKMFVVHPKNVNAENAPILPIMLSSKLLPEMEAEEALLKEQILAGVSSLPLQMQTEKIQKQIESVRKACEHAEKVLADNRKLYGLGSRQVPAIIPPLDKAQAAKIAEQEKLLRAAVNVGEGLRVHPSERQQPVSLPQHLVTALQSADGGSLNYSGLSKGQPSAIGTLPGTAQQVGAAQMLGRSVPSPMPILGPTALDGTSASPMQYANSPRSGNNVINDASPQQQQQQSLLQRQKVQQLQKQQHIQQQQQQLRQPGTPPIGQTHFHQLQQQQQAQLQQHIQAQQDRHHLQMQLQQQQALHQQLQSSTMQQGQQLQQTLGQNQLAQAGQAKPHLGQIGSNTASTLFGNAQLPTNVMANLGQSIPSQSTMLQQRLHLGGGMGAAGQAQRSLPAQMIADPMYNMGLSGSQSSANLGLPLQQQLVGQSNFNSILNQSQGLNFSQQRQQPPPSQ